MDWKEAAKWIAILVGAGAISAVIEVVIEDHIRGTVAKEARAEVNRTIAAAIAAANAEEARVRGARVTGGNIAGPYNSGTMVAVEAGGGALTKPTFII